MNPVVFKGPWRPTGPDLWRDWTEGNPHDWIGRISVHADFGFQEAQVLGTRADKKHFQQLMEGQCQNWIANPKSFAEDVDANYSSCRTTLIRSSDMTSWLIGWTRLLGDTDPVEVVNRFFSSEQWKEAPFAYLWVRLWAKIAEMARNPKGPRKPQPGDYFDPQILTYYAPYCDAIFVDKGYREISCDKRVNLDRFGTKCFSEQNRDEFMDYLKEIEGTLTEAHRNALEYAYPTAP
jgi:hypothetical protein